jgi:hypothetical protein
LRLYHVASDTALRDNNMRLKFLTGERLCIVSAVKAMADAQGGACSD